jgi:IS30 family transposase
VKLDYNKELFEIVKAKLKLYCYLRQIAHWLKDKYNDPYMQVSAEPIYSYIYILPRGELRKVLTQCLRRSHFKRKTRGHSQAGQTSNLADMLSIEERPAEVANRIIPGHWEGDLIMGGRTEQSALSTLDERTTRTAILVPLKSKKAVEVRKAFAAELKNFPSQFRLSLTYDQGREMAEYKLFTKSTKMDYDFI